MKITGRFTLWTKNTQDSSIEIAGIATSAEECEHLVDVVRRFGLMLESIEARQRRAK